MVVNYVVNSLGGGAVVNIVCQTTGTTYTGLWGSSNLWDKLSTGTGPSKVARTPA